MQKIPGGHFYGQFWQAFPKGFRRPKATTFKNIPGRAARADPSVRQRRRLAERALHAPALTGKSHLGGPARAAIAALTPPPSACPPPRKKKLEPKPDPDRSEQDQNEDGSWIAIDREMLEHRQAGVHSSMQKIKVEIALEEGVE